MPSWHMNIAGCQQQSKKYTSEGCVRPSVLRLHEAWQSATIYIHAPSDPGTHPQSAPHRLTKNSQKGHSLKHTRDRTSDSGWDKSATDGDACSTVLAVKRRRFLSGAEIAAEVVHHMSGRFEWFQSFKTSHTGTWI